MVDDSRGAATRRLDRSEERAQLDVFQGKGTVQRPPHQLENVSERTGRRRRARHASRQRRVEMVVSAAQAGKDQAARAVDFRRPLVIAADAAVRHDQIRLFHRARNAAGNGSPGQVEAQRRAARG
jgi:hypothetical protein